MSMNLRNMALTSCVPVKDQGNKTNRKIQLTRRALAALGIQKSRIPNLGNQLSLTVE